MPGTNLELRYGMNPHQRASIRASRASLPVTVLNGRPSAINLMDAMNSWQLARELRQVTGLPAAASFKHVSPSGAALGLPLSEVLRRAYAVDDLELTPLAEAYARARGTDPLCSYGDCAALSDPLDVATARLLKREVSDVLVAPGYDPEALDIVRQKKKGAYLVLEVDPGYTPPPSEQRDLFGMTLVQDRNTYLPRLDDHGRSPTRHRTRPPGPQVHAVELHRPHLSGTDARRRRGPAIANPLRADRRGQGGQVVSPTTPEGAVTAVPGWSAPSGSQQLH